MKKSFVALLFFALAGLVVSILMTKIHYQIGGLGLEGKSFCHVSEFFDCDAALASRYARLGRFLNSEFGVLYYLLVVVGILYAWLSEKRQSTLSYLFVSTIFAIAYSLYMAYVSLFKLGILCLLCTTSYAVNVALMMIFPIAMEIRYRDIPGFLIRYARSVVTAGDMNPRLVFHVGTTVFFAALGLIFFQGLNPEIHKAEAIVPKDVYLTIFKSQPQVTIDVAGRPYWGNKDAKVTIVEFSDFQCPFCRRAAFTLKPYLMEFRNDIKLVFVNFPLDAACNPAIPQTMHPISCVAAKAVLCAEKQGKFWPLHDEIFENQKKISRSILLNLGSKVGIDGPSFDRCLASNEITQVLKRDVDDGIRLKVEGTPAVYINGRQFGDWPDSERLRMVIESEILTSP